MATPAKAYPHHEMPRMIPGEFVGPNQAVGGRPTRFASAVLPRLSANPETDTSLVCLDLVQVSFADNPYDWTWVALSQAGVYTWGHTIGLNLHEPWRFVTWSFGSPRVYKVDYAESLAPGDIKNLYGPDAAGSARQDYNAVQLLLTRES
jgi:hypothetical protein